MSAAQSGDDEPPLARRRASGSRDAVQPGQGRDGQPPAGEGRSQRSLFQERDDDFEAIRGIIAKASRPGAVEADTAAAGGRRTPSGPTEQNPAPHRPAGHSPAPARAPAAARDPATAQNPALGNAGLKRSAGTAAEAARSVLRAGGEPAPVPPSPAATAAGGGFGATPPGDDVVLRQKGPPARGREGRGGGRRRGGWGIAVAILVLVLVLAVGAAAWYGMQNGLIPLGATDGDDDANVPTISADAGPVKVRPEDRGGMTIPDQDKRIYDRLAGGEAQPASEEKMLPPPETALSEAPEQDTDGGTAAPADAGETLAEAVGAVPALDGGPLAGESGSGTTEQAATTAGMTERTGAADPPAAVATPDRTSSGEAAPVQAAGAASAPDSIEDLLPPKPAASESGPPAEGGTADATAAASASPDAAEPETAQSEAPQADTAPTETAMAAPAMPVQAPDTTTQAGATAPADTAMQDRTGDSSAGGTEIILPPTENEPAAAGAEPEPPAEPETAAAPATAATPQAKAPPAGAILLQLAALRDDTAARSEWRRIQGRHQQELGRLTPYFQRVEIPGKGNFTRIQTGPFSSTAAAESACATLKSSGQGCFVVRR